MYRSDPITPGTFYDLTFDLQPKDMVIPAGRRLAFMILSSDNEHTLRPAPGTQLTVDTAHSDVVAADRGRQRRVRRGDRARHVGDVGGTVPATLALTMGARGLVRARSPRAWRRTTRRRRPRPSISTAGDAALTVSDPGHLMNGTFALPRAAAGVASASPPGPRPVSNEAVTVTFKQAIEGDRRAADRRLHQDADVHLVHHLALMDHAPADHREPDRVLRQLRGGRVHRVDR